jgi:hypothetical protein
MWGASGTWWMKARDVDKSYNGLIRLKIPIVLRLRGPGLRRVHVIF